MTSAKTLEIRASLISSNQFHPGFFLPRFYTRCVVMPSRHVRRRLYTPKRNWTCNSQFLSHIKGKQR